MKKKLFVTLIITLATLLCTFACVNAEENINVTLNDETVTFDTTPVMENYRILVPIRAIAEKMEFDVNWDQDTETVTLENFNTILTLKINENSINKKLKFASISYPTKQTDIILDTSSKILNDRTYIPLRAVTESFGCNVEWSQESNTAKIIYPNTYGEEVVFEDKGIEYLTKLELLLEGIDHSEGLKAFTLYVDYDLSSKIRDNTADELYPFKIHKGALDKLSSLEIYFYKQDFSKKYTANDISLFPNLKEKDKYISLLEIPNKYHDVIDKIITSQMNTKEKTKAIAKWISKNINYDYGYSHINAFKEKYNLEDLSINTTMLTQYGVCHDYSVTFEEFCDILDIPCICISGSCDGVDPYYNEGWVSHAWNVVKLEDGNFYHIDTTWGGEYINFLTSEELENFGDHTWNEEDIQKGFEEKYGSNF